MSRWEVRSLIYKVPGSPPVHCTDGAGHLSHHISAGTYPFPCMREGDEELSGVATCLENWVALKIRSVCWRSEFWPSINGQQLCRVQFVETLFAQILSSYIWLHFFPQISLICSWCKRITLTCSYTMHFLPQTSPFHRCCKRGSLTSCHPALVPLYF